MRLHLWVSLYNRPEIRQIWIMQILKFGVCSMFQRTLPRKYAVCNMKFGSTPCFYGALRRRYQVPLVDEFRELRENPSSFSLYESQPWIIDLPIGFQPLQCLVVALQRLN